MTDETRILIRDLSRAALGNGPVGWGCAILALACPGLVCLVLLAGWNPVMLLLGCAAPFPLALLAGVATTCRKRGDMAAKLSEHDSGTTWMTAISLAGIGVFLPSMVAWILFSPMTLTIFAICVAILASKSSRTALGRFFKIAVSFIDWKVTDKARFALLYPGALVPWVLMVISITLFEKYRHDGATDMVNVLILPSILLGGPVMAAFQAALYSSSKGKRLSEFDAGLIGGMFLLGMFFIPGLFIAMCRTTGLHPLALGLTVPVFWYVWCRILAGPTARSLGGAARNKAVSLWLLLWNRPMACPARRDGK